MLRLTIREPWATALACLGKDVENRSWAPTDHNLGNHVAFHAGLNLGEWRQLALAWPADGPMQAVAELARSSAAPPWLGKIVGCGRLKGWFAAGPDVPESLRKRATLSFWLPIDPKTHRGERVWAQGLTELEALAASASPWWLGPGHIGHVFTDRYALAEPVEAVGSLGYRPLDEPTARLVRAVREWRYGQS